MRHNLISYQTKPGRAEENRALIEAVFAELAVAKPEKLAIWCSKPKTVRSFIS